MPNPIEEMTEEQKEYEAENLAKMFDKLSRCCTKLEKSRQLFLVLASEKLINCIKKKVRQTKVQIGYKLYMDLNNVLGEVFKLHLKHQMEKKTTHFSDH